MSQGQQYLGLGLFVVAEALIFLPLLLMANLMVPGGELILQAGIITAALFLGLTLIAFTTKKDFTFLGGILKMGFIVASVALLFWYILRIVMALRR